MNSIFNDDHESTIDRYRWNRHENLFKPAFGRGCIADLPGFILKNFGVNNGQVDNIPSSYQSENPDHSVFFLLDGFGFSTVKYSLEKYGMKYLNRFFNSSEFRLITSVFPSTTSTATVTYHTNMQPIDHRVLGYTSYIPEAGIVCNMISMSPLGRNDVCILDNGYTLPWIKKNGTIYTKLRANDVQSFLYLPNAIKDSGITRITADGANISPYFSVSQMLTSLKRNLSTAKGKTFHLCYIPTIDTISHKIGPYSEETALDMEGIFMLLEKQFLGSGNLPHNTLISMSADHGHTVLDKRQKIDLSADRELKSYFSAPVVGDPRASFIRIKDGYLDSAMRHLSKTYGENFIPVLGKDLLKEGFFGTPRETGDDPSFPSDIILIPRGYTSIVDSSLRITDPGNSIDRMVGMHGGLSAEEMLVPFLTRMIA